MNIADGSSKQGRRINRVIRLIEKYQTADHTIFHGDAIDVLRNRIEDESVDLIFADPPYNIGKKFDNFDDKWPSDKCYAEWCSEWIDLCIRKLRDTGSMYLMTSTQAMPYIDLEIRTRITVMSRIVWTYDSSGVQAKNYFGSLYEPILFCVKSSKQYTFNSKEILIEAKTGSERQLIDYRKPIPTVYNSQKVPGNVWNFPRVRYRMDEYENHPSQKPEALLRRIILASSNEKETVLDPFAGSFTTGAVAKSLNRRSIGIEQSESYIRIGLRRVLEFPRHKGESLDKPIKNTTRKHLNGVEILKNQNTNQVELFGGGT